MAMVLLASRSSVITEDVTLAMNAGIVAMVLIIPAVRPAAAAPIQHANRVPVKKTMGNVHITATAVDLRLSVIMEDVTVAMNAGIVAMALTIPAVPAELDTPLGATKCAPEMQPPDYGIWSIHCQGRIWSSCCWCSSIC